MIRVNGLTKRIGARALFRDVSFVVNPGEVAGLVGPTGAGKTTLLGVLAGSERPDGGSVEVGRGLRVGTLAQGHEGDTRKAAEAFPHAFGAAAIEAELARFALALESVFDDGAAAELERAYDTALERLAETRNRPTDALWDALDLRSVAPDEPLSALSGGEQTKLGLIELLALEPGVMLLDEPTNNLDVAGMEWLDGVLEAFPGPIVAVSHDRAFLDDHASFVLELDAESGRVERFEGGYSEYAAEKGRRREDAFARYHRQEERDRRLQNAITGLDRQASGIENRTIHFYFRKRAAKVARRAVVMKRRLERELESGERVEKPRAWSYRVKVDLAPSTEGGRRLVDAAAVDLEVAGRRLVSGASFTLDRGRRTVLIGPNGSGKTTLLRAIAGEQAIAGGELRVAPSARIGYLPQESRLALEGADTPVGLVRSVAPLSETDARTFLHRFLFSGDSAFTPLNRLSYGERRRLELARLVAAGANLLLLDEPTNHLDIQSRESLESALDGFEGAVLLVTHDRHLARTFADRLFVLEAGRILEATLPGTASDSG